MKNKFLILTILISGAFLYPFGCEGQVKTLPTNPDSCDTVFIESPEIQKCADDLADALDSIAEQTSIIVVKTAQVANLETKVTNLNSSIKAKNKKITDLTATVVAREEAIDTNLKVIQGLEVDLSIQADVIAAQVLQIEEKDGQIVKLEADLAAKPKTETVYVEKDSITVGGIAYKVSEIDVILPTQSIDTVFLNTCHDVLDQNKVWYHAGDPNVWPHIIYFPTKELSMTAIQFNEPLTEDMKKYQTKFKVKRVRNHEDATTKYVNIPVDPSEYLPQQ